MPQNPETELGHPQAARGPPGSPPRPHGRRDDLQDAHPCATAHSSHGVRDEQRHHAGDPGHRRGKSPVRRSRDEGVQHARRSAGENGAQPLGRDGAPSNVVRSHRHLRQQRLWRARSCSSTSLLPRKSSTSGESPSGASSPSPTKTIHDRRDPRAGAPPSHHMPALGGPGVLRSRCTLLLLASRRGHRPVVTTLVITSL